MVIILTGRQIVGGLGVAVLLAGCVAGRRHAAVSPADPGAAAFQAYCAACHVTNAAVASVEAPPLDSSPWVAGPQDRLIRIVIGGLHGPVDVGGATYNQEMPAVGKALTDDQVAAVLSYVRRRFGAANEPVLPADVARVRAADRDRTGYWTAQELLRSP